MGNWFADMDLGVKYAIVLSVLFVLVVSYGCIKLFLQKQKIRRILAEEAAKAADEEYKIDQVALNQREEDEGDLFGIRALEKGFYGGVAQSQQTTPAASIKTLSVAHIPYGNTSRQQSMLSVATTTVGGTSRGTSPNRAQDRTVDMTQVMPPSPQLGAKRDHSPSDSNASEHHRTRSASPGTSPTRLAPVVLEMPQPAVSHFYFRGPELPGPQPAPLQYSNRGAGESPRADSPDSAHFPPRGSPPSPRGNFLSTHPGGGNPAPNREGLSAIYDSYYEADAQRQFDFVAPLCPNPNATNGQTGA